MSDIKEIIAHLPKHMLVEIATYCKERICELDGYDSSLETEEHSYSFSQKVAMAYEHYNECRFCQSEQKIPVIKHLRTLFGFGLKEAKDIVDVKRDRP